MHLIDHGLLPVDLATNKADSPAPSPDYAFSPVRMAHRLPPVVLPSEPLWRNVSALPRFARFSGLSCTRRAALPA